MVNMQWHVVRQAVPNDFEWLKGELEEFSSQYETKKPMFHSEEYSRLIFENIIDKHVALVSETPAGEPSGAICGMCTPHCFNPNIRVLTEVFLWVKGEYRRTTACTMLINAFTEVGKVIADWVLFATSGKHPISDISLGKLGYEHIETSYKLEV
jgi:hypothetical protein